MCSIDLEYSDVFTDTLVKKARKSHWCACCTRAIAKGESYIKHFSVFDGSTTSEKCCTQCHNDRVEFANHLGHMMSAPSYFPEMLQECVSEHFIDDDEPLPPKYGPMTKHEEQDLRWREMLNELNARDTVTQ